MGRSRHSDPDRLSKSHIVKQISTFHRATNGQPSAQSVCVRLTVAADEGEEVRVCHLHTTSTNR